MGSRLLQKHVSGLRAEDPPSGLRRAASKGREATRGSRSAVRQPALSRVVPNEVTSRRPGVASTLGGGGHFSPWAAGWAADAGPRGTPFHPHGRHHHHTLWGHSWRADTSVPGARGSLVTLQCLPEPSTAAASQCQAQWPCPRPGPHEQRQSSPRTPLGRPRSLPQTLGQCPTDQGPVLGHRLWQM